MNYIGLEFGKWKVLSGPHSGSDIPKSGYSGRKVWFCECECGFQTWHRIDRLLKKKSTGCINCNSIHRRQDNPRWLGFGELSKSHWNSICMGAKGRGHIIEITIEDAWLKFLDQGGMCSLTGIELKFGPWNKGTTTASLDRIDSNIGYLKDNIQWIHKDINMMKNSLNQDYFIEMCRLVSASR